MKKIIFLAACSFFLSLSNSTKAQSELKSIDFLVDTLAKRNNYNSIPDEILLKIEVHNAGSYIVVELRPLHNWSRFMKEKGISINGLNYYFYKVHSGQKILLIEREGEDWGKSKMLDTNQLTPIAANSIEEIMQTFKKMGYLENKKIKGLTYRYFIEPELFQWFDNVR